MKIKNYLFRFAVSLSAFILGLSLFSFGQYFNSASRAEEQYVAKVQSLSVEDITYPAPIIKNEPVIEQTEIETEPEEVVEYEFDASGEYYLIGEKPKGFKDFEAFNVSTTNYVQVSENDGKWIPIPPEGTFYAKKDFEYARILINNKQIAFETEKKNGISYYFVGEFIDEEEVSVGEYMEYAVLKGHLIKLKNGKKVAESDVKFAVSHGC